MIEIFKDSKDTTTSYTNANPMNNFLIPKLFTTLGSLKTYFLSFPSRSWAKKWAGKLLRLGHKRSAPYAPTRLLRYFQNFTSKKVANNSLNTIHRVIFLLESGQKDEAINLFNLEKHQTSTIKSRFLNGLSCANKNTRKKLWISSFEIITKTTNSPTPDIHFVPIQYWSQGKLPPDFEKIHTKWNQILACSGQQQIQLFNKSTARDWIASYTPELIKHFDKAPLYAIEADIFRIAFAFKNNCIWIDSDQYPKRFTPQLIQRWSHDCDTLLMFRWNRPWVTNSFFMTKKNSPLFRAMIEANLSYTFPKKEDLSRKDVLNSFGPGRFNKSLSALISEGRLPTDNAKVLNKIKPVLLTRDGWKIAFSNETSLCSLKPPFSLKYSGPTKSWHDQVK